MSAVLKKLSLIQPFHRKSGRSQRNKRNQEEEEKTIKKTAFQVDFGAPNNNEEYVRKIQDRIILKLVAPELTASTTNCEDGGEADLKSAKPAVEHIEDKGRTKHKKDKERDRNGKLVSKRLNEDRIQKMIELDDLYFKNSSERTVHKQVYWGHAGGANGEQGQQEQPIEISYPTTEVVGRGSFGVVFTTTIQETNEMVAIKKVLQDRRFKNRELEIMKLLKHPNVIDLKYYFYEKDPHGEVYLNLILDYMPQSLYQRLRHFVHLTSIMPRLEIKCYMYQLFKALNYLHHHANVCHRDIKPQNLLVDPQSWELKLCDFGSAKQLNPTEPNVSYICSRYYRAPELIFGATNYSNQIDVWSSGCVMAELLLGQPMFPGESGIDQLVEIIKILGTPSKQEICAMNPNYMEHKFPQIKPIPLYKVFKKEDDPTVEFLTNTLKYDPLERFNSLQCLCSTYFDELRFASDDLKQIVDNLKLLVFDYETELGHLTEDQLAAVKLKLMPSII